MWPKCFCVINYYKEHVSEAPTVPFVVGALRMPIGSVIEDDEECIAELAALIGELIDNTPEGYVLQLRRCGGLRQQPGQPGEPVIEAFREAEVLKSPYSMGQEMTSESQGRVTMLVFDEFLSEGYDADSIATALFEELGEYILASRFSFREGSYQRFNDDDRGIVNSAFGKQD